MPSALFLYICTQKKKEMDNKGYYKLLGVNENATTEEIQKKFRTLALKWHPDRWVNASEEEKKNAETKFKELNEAYSVLSDKDKRSAYDMGLDNSGVNTDWGEDGYDDMEEAFWRNFGGNPFKRRRQQTINKGPNIVVEVSLTMEEVINGAKGKIIEYDVQKPCGHCNGTGLGTDGRVENCPHCGGTGFMSKTVNQGFMQWTTRTPCPHCGGTGKHIINPCPSCGGTGFDKKPSKESTPVDIPAGIIFVGDLAVSGHGGYPSGGTGVRGDLILHFTLYLPQGYALTDNRGGIEYKLDVPFYDAMLGCEKEVVLPSGKKEKIKIPENTVNGYERIFRGEGISSQADFKIVVNYTQGVKKLTAEQKDLLNNFKKTIK